MAEATRRTRATSSKGKQVPELCARIRWVRERVVDISQEEAARRIAALMPDGKFSLGAYRAYEHHREPKPQMLRTIAKAFGLDENYFMEAESFVRLSKQVDEILERLNALERDLPETIEAALRRVLATPPAEGGAVTAGDVAALAARTRQAERERRRAAGE